MLLSQSTVGWLSGRLPTGQVEEKHKSLSEGHLEGKACPTPHRVGAISWHLHFKPSYVTPLLKMPKEVARSGIEKVLPYHALDVVVNMSLQGES